MTKKKWQKPELLVIVRRRPEEAVLAGCKSHFVDTGPYTEPEWGPTPGYSCMGDNQQGLPQAPSCRGYSGS
jgi:hypothetical protein